MKKKAIVTGAGGFIGSHFVSYLKKKNYDVIGIDLKLPEFSPSQANTFVTGDLRKFDFASKYILPADALYMFAADMGGMGYIDHIHAKIMYDNTLINTNSLEAAKNSQIKNIFFASSACVYPMEKQKKATNLGLREEDAIPANPDTMYGWEKLFSEMLIKAYAVDFGMNVHIARFHNIYGPEGTYEGGREKSIAALCRKIAMAENKDSIEVWGDGKQTRSYCYIEDCCNGVYRLMQTSYHEAVNIGSSESITVNQLVSKIAKIANKKIYKKYNLQKPQGVRGRNSDNTLLKKILNWEPKISLDEGINKTYQWINKRVNHQD